MEKKSYVVGELGLKHSEAAVLKTLFTLHAKRAWTYTLLEGVSEADIWIVDMENPGARNMWRSIRPMNLGAGCIEIFSSQETIQASDGDALFVRPLRLPHLVKAIDEIVVKRFGYIPPISDNSTIAPELISTPDAGAAMGSMLLYRALVVDDSPTIRALMDASLRGLGIEPTLAEDASDALWQLGRGAFDIIFLDVVMPGEMDGYKLCKVIKGEARMHDVPVILLTSKDSAFDKIRGKLSGSNAYLTKPVDHDALVGCIRRFLRI